MISIKSYLRTVVDLVKANVSDSEVVQLENLENCYVISCGKFDAAPTFFGIKFIESNRIAKDPSYIPTENLLDEFRDQLHSSYDGVSIHVTDVRIIDVSNPQEMSRAAKMADTIVRAFQVVTVRAIRNISSAELAGSQYVIDTSISEAKRVENQWSPYGVRPRLEVALTLKAKTSNDEYQDFGVIGGYVDIKEKEFRTGSEHEFFQYTPIFNITTLMTAIPVEGTAAILLGTFLPIIYESRFWVNQWRDLTNGRPNPGNLERDPSNPSKMIQLQNDEELIEFVKTYFAPIVVVYQSQEGRDSIPGISHLFSDNLSNKVTSLQKLFNFMRKDSAPLSFMMPSRIVESLLDGIYKDGGSFLDSREIDYLSLAAKNDGMMMDSFSRRTLRNMSHTNNARSELVRANTEGYAPLWWTVSSAINPDFIRWIVEEIGKTGIVIIDPNHRVSDSISKPFAPITDSKEETNNTSDALNDVDRLTADFMRQCRDLQQLGKKIGMKLVVIPE